MIRPAIQDGALDLQTSGLNVDRRCQPVHTGVKRAWTKEGDAWVSTDHFG